MAFTETTTIQEIVILPLESNVQIKRRTVVEKDGDFVSNKDHYQIYAADNAEAIAIVQAANVKGIADAAAALAAKATAEAALSTATTAHTAALAAKDATIAQLQAQIDAATPAPVGTPQSVSMRQARLALHEAGLLDDVNTAMAGAGSAAQIEWEYADSVARSSALVAAMAGALSLTTEQLDDLFALAATL